MIVNHDHRYVFWQVPNTGSSAVAAELCAHYGGEHVLAKHAHPNALLRTLPERGRGYFVFATIRHPLDVVVTNYHKALRNYRQASERGEQGPRQKGTRHRRKAWERASWIAENDADFSAYFLRLYTRTFFSSTAWMVPRLSALIRQESLSEGLHAVLGELGIEPVRELPVRNTTATKKRAWFEYYSADAQRRAVELFTPYLDNWEYALPDEWERVEVPSWRRGELARIDRAATPLVAGRGLLPRSKRVRAAVFAARLPTLLTHPSAR